MDILFGTYRCPDHEPAAFGIHERSPQTYLGHLIEPLLPSSTLEKRETHRENATATTNDRTASSTT